MKVATIPHLQIAAQGPLRELENKILNQQIQIESWFRSQWQKTPPPFYCSVDLRNAGYKLAPIDTNLFPAGFNNIDSAFLPLCVQAAQETIERLLPGCQKILLIPENHSRNLNYYENVASIVKILQCAGYQVVLGRLPEHDAGLETIELNSGRQLKIQQIQKQGNRVVVDGFSPCLVLLNHDLSEGIPESLQNLQQQIMPALQLGWSNRLKSKHFTVYSQICREFSELIGIDPWWIDPIFRRCEEVNFLERGGDQCLERHTKELFAEIQAKYDQYNIDEKPFVVVKADSGTYGMGVMVVTDPKQVYELNRKQRKKMTATKGGKKINKVILQEGVFSFETINEQVAEPVIYMIGKNVIGGFYRIHKDKAANENLNAPGMHFESLAFAESCNLPNPAVEEACCPNRFYTYGVIARLALLAAAREQNEID